MGRLLEIARRAAQGSAKPPAPPRAAGLMRLSKFATAGLLLAVHLPQLKGEVVWLASDNTPLALDALGHYQGRVVYRAREWQHLYALRVRGELDDIGLRLIHEAKKVFGGEVIEPSV